MAALEALEGGDSLQLYNLGTGHGTSVKELISAFEQATNVRLPYAAADRRPGDVAAIYAEAKKAQAQLNWRATRNIAEMCADSWRYAKGKV